MQAEGKFGIMRGMMENANPLFVSVLAIAGVLAAPLRSGASVREVSPPPHLRKAA